MARARIKVKVEGQRPRLCISSDDYTWSRAETHVPKREAKRIENELRAEAALEDLLCHMASMEDYSPDN